MCYNYQTFYNHYDKVVADWLKNPQLPVKGTAFAEVNNLDINGMPEPYFGDPENCSAVIINLNPGPTICTNDIRFENSPHSVIQLLKRYCSSKYSTFAIPFPYLSSSISNGNKSKQWWVKRNEWIQRLLDDFHKAIVNNPSAKEIEHICRRNDKNNPFAIEICHLHSNNWENPKGWTTPSKQHIYDYTFLPAIYAIKNSSLGFGLAIGKPIYNLLIDFGFIEVARWGVDGRGKTRKSSYSTKNIQAIWPKNKEGQDVSRMYVLLYNKELDVYILCTWHQGGNKMPGNEFIDVDRLICEEIVKRLCSFHAAQF